MWDTLKFIIRFMILFPQELSKIYKAAWEEQKEIWGKQFEAKKALKLKQFEAKKALKLKQFEALLEKLDVLRVSIVKMLTGPISLFLFFLFLPVLLIDKWLWSPLKRYLNKILWSPIKRYLNKLFKPFFEWYSKIKRTPFYARCYARWLKIKSRFVKPKYVLPTTFAQIARLRRVYRKENAKYILPPRPRFLFGRPQPIRRRGKPWWNWTKIYHPKLDSMTEDQFKLFFDIHFRHTKSRPVCRIKGIPLSKDAIRYIVLIIIVLLTVVLSSRYWLDQNSMLVLVLFGVASIIYYNED